MWSDRPEQVLEVVVCLDDSSFGGGVEKWGEFVVVSKVGGGESALWVYCDAVCARVIGGARGVEECGVPGGWPELPAISVMCCDQLGGDGGGVGGKGGRPGGLGIVVVVQSCGGVWSLGWTI